MASVMHGIHVNALMTTGEHISSRLANNSSILTLYYGIYLHKFMSYRISIDMTRDEKLSTINIPVTISQLIWQLHVGYDFSSMTHSIYVCTVSISQKYTIYI